MLELALLLPWTIFLFVGIVDWGFFSYSLISIQGAARIAAFYTSTSSTTAADSSTACTIVLNDLAALPNIGTSVTNCAANPIIVTATPTAGSDGAAASVVSVTYQSMPLIPIPGLLQKQFTWTRSVTMRLRG
jgi:Flp pilus assembly protein TadG